MSIKIVKFAIELVPLILSGEKTSTWRLFDDKDLQVGDEIELTEFGQEVPFARARIVQVAVKKFGQLSEADKHGHENYESDTEMYRTYAGYYKTEVGPETELKIVHFEVE